MSLMSPSSPRTEDHFIEHLGWRLFCRSWWPQAQPPAGGRAPIVLLHDSLGCVELWRDFPAALAGATGRRVVAYDRLGFGRSDARLAPILPGFIADEAGSGFAAVRKALGLGRFVVFGHSVGGGMAIHCAAAFAGDCEAVITESAQAFVEDRTLAGIRAAREQFRDPAQMQRLARYHGPRAQWVLDAWTETWLHPDFAGWSLDDVLPRVSAPVLALHGAQDEYGSAAHPHMIASHCGGPAQVEILADTGHVPHRERPDAVLSFVARFLDMP